MRKDLILAIEIALVLMFIYANESLAQNDVSTVYVNLSTDSQTELYAQNFFARLRDDFCLPIGDCVTLVKTSNLTATTNLEIEFSQTTDSKEVQITFTPLTPKTMSGSQYLIPILDHGIAVGYHPDDTLVESFVTDIAKAISDYTVGICSSDWEAIRDTWELGHDSDIASNVAFYESICALQNGDYQKAIELLNKYETHYESSIVPKIDLAWAYLKNGDESKAFDTIDSLISAGILIRSKITILTHRAQLYALAFRYDDALADMNAAIQLDPTNPELYAQRGQVYILLYEWDNVLADYNKAIELDPTYADAYFNRGVLYYSILQTGAEHYPDALADFQKYLELAPDGDHAADAAKYVEQIQAQQNALNS